MIRNLISIKENIIIPVTTAVTKTVGTLVNSELAQTAIETKANLTRTALSLGPKIVGGALSIAERKAAIFQLALCKLFCPLTGGSPEGVKKCQKQHCKKRDGKSARKSDDENEVGVDQEDDDDAEKYKQEDDDKRKKREHKVETEELEEDIAETKETEHDDWFFFN